VLLRVVAAERVVVPGVDQQETKAWV
jgi:hypothetical protein